MVNKKSSIFFFKIYALFSLSNPTALAQASRDILNRNGERGYPCLIPDFRQKAFVLSPLNMVLAIVLGLVFFVEFLRV